MSGLFEVGHVVYCLRRVGMGVWVMTDGEGREIKRGTMRECGKVMDALTRNAARAMASMMADRPKKGQGSGFRGAAYPEGEPDRQGREE